MLQSELERVDATLGRARRFAMPGEREHMEDNSAFEAIAEDAAGRLVVPATVAARLFQHLRSNREIQVAICYTFDWKRRRGVIALRLETARQVSSVCYKR
jgi:hypothetical protein